MTGTIKRTLKKAVTESPMLLRTLNSFAAKKPRVLMYHRFAPPGRPVPHRVTADVFAWQLDVISRDFRVISLGECIAHYTAQREWPQGCVVLTIDDGYRDVYQWAYPELVKRNLSATFFVTTGFVDGAIWLWPDRIDYALRHTGAASCVVPVGGREVRVYLTDATERFKAWRALSDHCIALEDDSRRSYLARMEEVLGVELPQLPPPEYEAVRWEDLREMQRGGIEIGAHTVHHPILSKVSSVVLAREVGLCRETLQARLRTPIHSFCYPNCGPGDVNDEVVAAVAAAGYSGAVFGNDLARWDRYLVPRMGISDDRTDFLWKIYGGESLRSGASQSRRR